MSDFLKTASEILNAYHQDESIFQAPIKMDKIANIIKNMAKINDVQYILADMNKENLRGFVIVTKLTNSENDENKSARVYLSNSLNPCWTRFTACKELFHLLDGVEAQSNTRSHLISLLDKITSDIRAEKDNDQQIAAEDEAAWAAIELLFPYEVRSVMLDAYQDKIINAYDIALATRIPERYVRAAMTGTYHRIITHYRNSYGIADIKPE